MSSAVTLTPQADEVATPRLLTAADVAALPRSLPSGDVRYELFSGILCIMAPPGKDHSASQVRIGAELLYKGERAGHGEAYSEIGLILSRNPDTLCAPDAMFIAKRSLPSRQSREGYIETIPDLVVEVRSKNDTLAELQQKVRDYLQAGVKLVWLADPFAKTIAIHRPDTAPQTLSEADTLTAGDIIPGFQVPVAELFRD